MAFNLTVIKQHPWITGAIVLVVGVGLYFILSNSGGGGGVAAPAGPSAAQIAAGSHAMDVSASLQAQGTQDQFQLAYLQQQQQGDAAKNQLTYNVAIDTLAGQLQTVQAQLGTQLALQSNNNTTAVTLNNQQLQAQIDITHDNNATQIAQEQALMQEQEFSIATQNATQTAIAGLNAQVAQAQIGANVSIAGINAGTTQYLAKQQADVAKAQAQASSSSSIFGSILGFAAAFI